MSYIGVLPAARKASLDSGNDGVINNLIVTSNMNHMVFGPLGKDYLFGRVSSSAAIWAGRS